MSEYWKSTPKYWCKQCKTFVRDTKLETANHNASPKHQGNLKRFLRDLQRNHEKSEKDKANAKSEVARLNGLVSSSKSKKDPSSSNAGFNHSNSSSTSGTVTESQRKQHLVQLAEMGVNIPTELRPEMAMPGEWQIVSERILDPMKESRVLDNTTTRVRKRLLEEEDEEEEIFNLGKKTWGSTTKNHSIEDKDQELDALLNNSDWKTKNSDPPIESKMEIKLETEAGDLPQTWPVELPKPSETSEIKSEPGEPGEPSNPILKSLEDANSIESKTHGVVFKKRKVKNIRHK